MSRSRKIWTGGLLSLTLTMGCQHTGQPASECSTCSATQTETVAPQPPPQRLALVPVPARSMPAAPPAAGPTTPYPSLVPITPSQIAVSRSPAPRTLPPVMTAPAAPVPQPAVNPEQSAPPNSPWTLPNPETMMPAPETLAAPSPAPVAILNPAPTAAPTPIVSTAPISTATPSPASIPTIVVNSPAGPAPQYFNSPDYSILLGVLDYNARRGTWRLRYADAGDEDRYGGSVTLDGIGRQMDGYTSGEFVRIEGGLVDPESRDASPAYRVREMRPATAGK